jgi:HD-like signal output (HDOD) protein
MFDQIRSWLTPRADPPAIELAPGSAIPASSASATPAPKLSAVRTLDELASAFSSTLLRGSKNGESTIGNATEQQIYREVLERMQKGVDPDELPKLPTAVAMLMKRLNDTNATYADMAKLINQDPVLASEVLTTCNSPFYRTCTEEITNIEQAVSLLGISRLASITLEILMRSMFEIKPIYFRYFARQLWQHSQECARISASLAQREAEDEFTAYLVGLTHDVGKLVIFQSLMKAIRTAHPDHQPNPAMVSMIIDRTALQLSCTVIKSWELPMVVQIAICAQTGRTLASDRKGLARLLYRANLLAEVRMLMQERQIGIEEAEELLAQHDLSLGLLPQSNLA